MCEGGPVCSDDALRELGYNRVGKFIWTSLPHVSAAVWGRRDGSCITRDVRWGGEGRSDSW